MFVPSPTCAFGRHRDSNAASPPSILAIWLRPGLTLVIVESLHAEKDERARPKHIIQKEKLLSAPTKAMPCVTRMERAVLIDSIVRLPKYFVHLRIDRVKQKETDGGKM